MSKITSAQQEKWVTLLKKNYADQAVWFLNGFWDEGLEAEAEKVWGFAQTMAKLDEAKKSDGTELDEFLSHKFLETLGETLTVVALREKMRAIDLDVRRSSLSFSRVFFLNDSLLICSSQQFNKK